MKNILLVGIQISFAFCNVFQFLTDINSKCIRTIRRAVSSKFDDHADIRKHCSNSNKICRKNFIQGNNANHIAAKMCRDDILRILFWFGGNECYDAETFWSRNTIDSIWAKYCLDTVGPLNLLSSPEDGGIIRETEKKTHFLSSINSIPEPVDVASEHLEEDEFVTPYFIEEDVIQINVEEKSPYRYTIENGPRMIPLVYEIPINEELKYPVFHRGLRNSGNTCFLNSAIQILLRSSRFRDAVRSSSSNGKLTTIFKTLLETFNHDGEAVDIENIAKLISDHINNPRIYEFKGQNSQWDMSEALFKIFDILDAEQDQGNPFSSLNSGEEVHMKYKYFKMQRSPNETENQYRVNSQLNIELLSDYLLDKNDGFIDLEDFILREWNFIDETKTPGFTLYEKTKMKILPKFLVIYIDNSDNFGIERKTAFSIPQELKFFDSQRQTFIYKFVGVGHHTGFSGGGHWESTSCWNNQCVRANDEIITSNQNLFCTREGFPPSSVSSPTNSENESNSNGRRKRPHNRSNRKPRRKYKHRRKNRHQ